MLVTSSSGNHPDYTGHYGKLSDSASAMRRYFVKYRCVKCLLSTCGQCFLSAAVIFCRLSDVP